MIVDQGIRYLLSRLTPDDAGAKVGHDAKPAVVEATAQTMLPFTHAVITKHMLIRNISNMF